MIVTCYRRIPVRASIDWVNLGAYLARTGWELVQLGEWVDDVLDSFKIARWKRGHDTLTIRDDMDAERLATVITRLARLDDREDAEVLADIAGVAILDRGTAINSLATAGARLVEAREALLAAETALRAKPKERPRRAAVEAATGRVRRAEQDVEQATAALRAAEGAGA